MKARTLIGIALAVAIAAAAGSHGAPSCSCGTVPGEAPCCTYTIGWWKNHDKYEAQDKPRYVPWPTNCPNGPLDDGEDSILFGGLTARAILNTVDGGDKCYQTAHQYIAAVMNQCKGACVDATVQASMSTLYAILTTPGVCPGGLGAQGNNTALRADAITAAAVLADYNEGNDVGPGHCDDEAPAECPVYDCDGGCTLTQGYWKTHSSGAKKPSPWSDIEGCPHAEVDTLYGDVQDSVTWLGALTTPPAGGDACLIAAKQYVAAKLNIDCNGACVPEAFVADALACVKATLDSAFCPGLAPGSGPLTDAEKAARAAILTCAGTLDAYNNGFLLGPGHCDEEGAGNGKGNGADKEVDAVTLASSVDGGVQIAILVIISAVFCGVVYVVWYVWRRTNRSKRTASFHAVDDDDESGDY